MFRTDRKLIRSITGDVILNDEQLRMVMAEVMFIIKNRPLVPANADAKDDAVLTPSMIAGGVVDAALPPHHFVKADGYRLSYKLMQLLANRFWRVFIKDYLPLLQQRSKWRSPVRNLRIGDVVLIADKDLPRNCWKKAVVSEVLPDLDGSVRRAIIRVSAGSTYERAVQQLCLLEAAD